MRWIGEVVAPSTKDDTVFGIPGPGLPNQTLPGTGKRRAWSIGSTAYLPPRGCRAPFRAVRPMCRRNEQVWSLPFLTLRGACFANLMVRPTTGDSRRLTSRILFGLHVYASYIDRVRRGQAARVKQTTYLLMRRAQGRWAADTVTSQVPTHCASRGIDSAIGFSDSVRPGEHVVRTVDPSAMVAAWRHGYAAVV